MNREAVIPGARCPIAVPGGDAQFLSEAQGLRFLAEQGLPVVEHTTCHTLETAHTAMRQLAATVVLKGSSSAVQHKTEHGLVCVDISTESELVHSFETIRARMKTMTVDSDGVIVARMICNAWEFMLGAHVDPVFGVVVLIGEGGRYVEVTQNIAAMAPPFLIDEVLTTLRALPRAAVWEGVRGEPGADLDGICSACVSIWRSHVGHKRYCIR